MVIEITKPEEGEDLGYEMIPIFTLEGVTYSIPDRVRPNVSLKYIWMVRQSGPVAAEAWLGQQLLGEEGYVAYLNCDYITQEQSDAIFDAGRAVVFGEARPKSPPETPANTSTRQKARSNGTKRSNGQRARKQPSKATSAATTE